MLIGGQTAIFDDFSTVLSDKLPLFIGVVVLISFLLLMAVFRSLLIPVIAAAMNLLAAAASFGVITAVFQWGWAASLLGIDKTGPIEAFVPVMMFAIVFGLSMDYQVFLVSRIYEEWHRTGDNQLAVTRGLAATGRTITAAAAIMILVFGAFILGGERVIMLFGLGLAGAVLLDALVDPHGARARADAAHRQGQLVAAALARPRPAAPQRRGRRARRAPPARRAANPHAPADRRSRARRRPRLNHRSDDRRMTTSAIANLEDASAP